MYLATRLKFQRLGPVKYLGHLDMLRYFQKAILRAGLPIRYSEGFNPHQILSFAYPLGVSMETKGDYLDLDLVEPDSFSFSSKEEELLYLTNVKDSLNAVMSEGIQILSASFVPEGELNSMASVAAADYLVRYSSESPITTEELNHFLSQSSILIEKEGKEKGKKVQKTADIRPGILDASLVEDEIFLKLCSGSSNNVKAATVLEQLAKFLNKDLKLDGILRLEIYRETAKGYLPLGDFDS